MHFSKERCRLLALTLHFRLGCGCGLDDKELKTTHSLISRFSAFVHYRNKIVNLRFDGTDARLCLNFRCSIVCYFDNLAANGDHDVNNFLPNPGVHPYLGQ